jgi:hypothetical protein
VVQRKMAMPSASDAVTTPAPVAASGAPPAGNAAEAIEASVPAPAAAGFTPASSNNEALVAEVMQQLLRRLEIERERRGIRQWR